MKPSHLIKQECKTKAQQLKVCYTLIDYFLGTQEVEWAIECENKKNIKRSVSKK
jgi:hypothetical protein